MVLPWRYVAALYVVGTAIGAGITYLVRGELGAFVDPAFHLFSATGWLLATLVLRWLAAREDTRTRS
jgi:hypothetical protein